MLVDTCGDTRRLICNFDATAPMVDRKQLSITYAIHPTRATLVDRDKVLIESALEASEKAYAPYSEFHVGAALELDNGEIVVGNNQENASFPAGICAERVAMYTAHAQQPDHAVRSIAVIALSDRVDIQEPVPPCGICRQVVAEYEAEQDKPIRVILATVDGPVHIFNSMKDLLPFHFHETSLKRK